MRRIAVFLPVLAALATVGHFVFTGNNTYAWFAAHSGALLSGALGFTCAFIYAPFGKAKSLFLLVSTLLYVLSITTWFGPMGDYFWLVACIELVLVVGWTLKQALIVRPASDPFNKKNYCILLAPVNNKQEMFNLLRLSTWAVFGGRTLIANRDTWLVHRGSFKKKNYALVKKSGYKDFVLIDTGIEINEKHNKKMDDLVGTQFRRLFNDCAKLNGGSSLGIMLIKRQLLNILKS